MDIGNHFKTDPRTLQIIGAYWNGFHYEIVTGFDVDMEFGVFETWTPKFEAIVKPLPNEAGEMPSKEDEQEVFRIADYYLKELLDRTTKAEKYEEITENRTPDN